MTDMTLSEELKWRGLINQTTLKDISQLDKQKLVFYHGFDASADSQTVGNLAGMMFDKVLMRHGHKAVILAGGATSLIGDPGGKDLERPLQDESTIARNISCAEIQMKQVFTGCDFTLVNNLDWTKDLSVISFLRDIGKYFSMTPLIQRDFIAKRLGESGTGISYTEFSYSLLQAMDFLHLYDNYDVSLQVGSSDQWGNCLSGIELIRKIRNAEANVLTHPLVINSATGKKFGRSEEGAVWLDPKKTSPTQFYQFWVNVDDESVEKYIKVYSELGKIEVDEIMDRHRQDPKLRFAQKRLAQEVTKIVHGKQQSGIAEEITRVIVGELKVGNATAQTVESMRNEMASVKVNADAVIIDVLVKVGLASSNSDARQLIASGAIYINGTETKANQFAPSDFLNGRLLLRKGKVLKNTALIEQD